MSLVLRSRLTIPLWVIAFFTVVLTAPPTATLFLMPPATVVALAAVGMAAIVFLTPGAIPWFRSSRALGRVLLSGRRDQASAAITLAPGAGGCAPDEPNRITTDDALALVRMDDDGGWQMPRPPA